MIVLTNDQKVAAFQKIVAYIEKNPVWTLRVPIENMVDRGELHLVEFFFLEEQIEAEIKAKNAALPEGSAWEHYMFEPFDDFSHIAWCQQKIEQLQA